MFECSLTGRLIRLRGKTDAAGVLRNQLGLTGYQANRMTKLSEALEEMPNTKARLADGRITLAHVNTLANTAQECGARDVDQDSNLLYHASRVSPDWFSRRAQRWANQHATDRGMSLFEMQRSRRRAFSFWSRNKQMGVLHAERTDGRPSTRLIITAEIGLVDGTDPNGKCEIIDTGPVPPAILKQLSPDTQISGTLYDRSGNPLWFGRSQRLATANQRLAAAVRDQGCVLCPAPTHQTQLHHIREWGRGGRTDIDNLASLCGPDHRNLQNRNLRLVKTVNGWAAIPRNRPPPNGPP